MFRDILSKIVAGIAAIFGALFLYQKHKTRVSNDERDIVKQQLEDLKVEMRVEKADQELQTEVIEGKSLKSSVDRKKIIEEELKKQQENVKKSVKGSKDGEDFTFRT